MSSKPEPPLLPHSYDGIQEHDNPLPGWWSAIFLVSVVFAIGYWYWFHAGGSGKSETEEYAIELVAHEAFRAEAAKNEQVSERVLVEAVGNPVTLDRGRALYGEKCATCHGPAGAGLVGPNLTDDRQIHGATRMDVYLTVRDGVPAKGMLAWGTMMAPADVIAATAFVISLRGTNVAGKAPEGSPVGKFEALP